MPGGTADPPSPLERVIARELRRLLASQDRSQADLARASGVPESAVSRTLGGQRSIRMVDYIKLCEALHVAPGTLMALAEARLHEFGELEPQA